VLSAIIRRVRGPPPNAVPRPLVTQDWSS
jgi:hypothetical protein